MYRFVFKTALLFLLRRKVRSLLVIAMIALAIWGLMLMQGVYEGMSEQMIANAIRSDSAQMSIYAKPFRLERGINQLIPHSNQLTQQLRQTAEVANVRSRIVTDVLIATARYSRGGVLYGVNLNEEREQAALNSYLLEGSYSFGAKGNGALVGYRVAQRLHITVGSRVILSAQNSRGDLVSIRLKVTGIIKSNTMMLDETALFIDRFKAASLLEISNAHQLLLNFHDAAMIKPFQKAWQMRLDGLELLRWDELYPALMQSRVMMKSFSRISYMLVFFIATLGIFGVILVSVLERLREFGIMQAIGTRFSLIAKIVLVESLLIGSAGYLLGALLGSSTLLYLQHYGLDLSAFSDALDEFGMDAVTYAVIRSEYFMSALLSVLGATLLSTLFPLRVLKRSKPAEVIHE